MTIKISSGSVKSKISYKAPYQIKTSEDKINVSLKSKVTSYIDILKSIAFAAKPKSDIDFYVKFKNISSGGNQALPIGVAVIGVNFRIL